MERDVCVHTVMYEVFKGSLVGFFGVNLHLCSDACVWCEATAFVFFLMQTSEEREHAAAV